MSMVRFPEPELMQDLHQVRAYSEADFSNSEDSLIARLDEYLIMKGKTLGSDSLIVDLGCGPGNITERLSCKWPKARIVGIDGSQAMLAMARSRAEKRKSNGDLILVSYVCCDISLIANGQLNLSKPVDLVVSNSLLHHICDPSLFWKAVSCLTAKHSVHFHRDLRRPSTFEKAIALQKTYLKDAPEVLVKDYLCSLCAAFTIKEVKEQINSERLEQLNVYEVDDRYLEVVGIF